MHTEARNLFAHVSRLWRTFAAVLCSGLLISALDDSSTPVLLATLAGAFLFSSYEQRYWVVMPTSARLADTLLRISLAFGWTYALAFSEHANMLQVVRL